MRNILLALGLLVAAILPARAAGVSGSKTTIIQVAGAGTGNFGSQSVTTTGQGSFGTVQVGPGPGNPTVNSTITNNTVVVTTASIVAGTGLIQSTMPVEGLGVNPQGTMAEFATSQLGSVSGNPAALLVLADTQPAVTSGLIGLNISTNNAVSAASVLYDFQKQHLSMGAGSNGGNVTVGADGSISISDGQNAGVTVQSGSGGSGTGPIQLETSGSLTLTGNNTSQIQMAASGAITVQTSNSQALSMTAAGGINLNSSGQILLNGGTLKVNGVSAGFALCINSSGLLSHCSSAVGAGGGCTCP